MKSFLNDTNIIDHLYCTNYDQMRVTNIRFTCVYS